MQPDSPRASNLDWGPFGRTLSGCQDIPLAKGTTLRAKLQQEDTYCYFSQGVLALSQTLRRKRSELRPPTSTYHARLCSEFLASLALQYYMTYVTSVSHHSLCTSGTQPGLSKQWVRCKFPHTIVLHPHHLPGAFPPAASHPASAESGKITPSPCPPVKEPHPGPGRGKAGAHRPQRSAAGKVGPAALSTRSTPLFFTQRLPRGPSCCSSGSVLTRSEV